jgi:uncharacterized LabA/DUF88 family protein
MFWTEILSLSPHGCSRNAANVGLSDFMVRSAILLIDGSNVYHSLKNMNMLPFDGEEYRELFEKLGSKFKIKEIIFYDAVKNSFKDSEGYSKQQRFHERLRRASPKLAIKTRKLQYYDEISDEKILSASDKVGLVEICKTRLRALLSKLGLINNTKEKGIDVMIVIDAIEKAMNKEVETIILFSGDADFVPLAHIIKKYGLRMVNLHMFDGSSKELRDSCDMRIQVVFDSLKDFNLKFY